MSLLDTRVVESALYMQQEFQEVRYVCICCSLGGALIKHCLLYRELERHFPLVMIVTFNGTNRTLECSFHSDCPISTYTRLLHRYTEELLPTANQVSGAIGRFFQYTASTLLLYSVKASLVLLRNSGVL